MDSFIFFVLLSCMAVDVMCAEEDCRQLEFRSHLSFNGTRLINHIIKTVESVSKDFCGPLCFMEPNCVSFNMEVVSRSSSVINCELNNSTHNEHPDDLKECQNYIYRGSEHACSEKPCANNGICQAGFTDKGYRCVCAAGFTGQDCKDDVDECNAATHKCPVNADCHNTHGSYNCTCKSGYSRNGLNCTDIDECAAPVGPCNTVANSACSNTNGSYTCQCIDGFIKNGLICEADVCQNYQNLTDAERKVTFETVSASCDSSLTGWYRFQGAAGTKMVDVKCPDVNRCGGTFPGWLSGGHPTEAEGIVTRTVCFHKPGDCCADMTTIKVKDCGSYYIYELSGTPGCSRRYCGTD